MKINRRVQCSLFALLLGLSSIVSSIGFSDSASAWAPVWTPDVTHDEIKDFLSTKSIPGLSVGQINDINSVIYTSTNPTYENEFFIGYSENPQYLTLTDDGEDIGTVQSAGMCRFAKNLTGGVLCNSYTPPSTWSFSAQSVHYFDLTDEYKEFWEGEPFLEYYLNIIDRETIYPEVDYQVSNRDLKAQYKKNVPNASHISWLVYEADDDYSIVGDPIYTEINNHISVDDGFDYKFSKTGKYVLTIGVTSLPPYLPIPDDYRPMPIVVQLNVDGTDFSGSTTAEGCQDGYCEVQSPYEDCSEYGTDIAGAIGCHFGNMLVALKIMLTFLFVPSRDFLSDYWTAMSEFLNEKLGFLYQSIASVVSFLGILITSAATADCDYVPSGTFYGSSITIDACVFEEVYPAGFTVFRSLVTAITVLALVMAFQRRYHEALESR